MRIAVPDLVSNSYFPAVAALNLGFFSAEGLTANLQHIHPLPKTMQALKDGQIDFVAGSAHGTLTAFPNWDGVKLVVALAQKTYWMLILRTNLGAKRGDIQAVKGLRIAAAPGPDLALRHLLTKAGIDLQKDLVNISPLPGTSDSGVSFGIRAALALKNGLIDGFWANGMASEVAIRNGTGSVILDLRRGIGPREAQFYTFPALITTTKKIDEDPESVSAAVRAIVKVQKLLRNDPTRSTEVGKLLFPEPEAGFIAALVKRDLPYYNPTISEDAVSNMNRFAIDIGKLATPVPYEKVVATRFQALWSE